jgi:ketosteroid isomerase-like protein
MSQENVEIIRRGIDLVNEGELQAVLEFIDECFDPDVELRAVGRLPDAGRVLRGNEAAKAWWVQLHETFDFQWEPEELIDAGDAVLMVNRQIARGRGSGAEVTNRVVTVNAFRNGRIIRTDAYRGKQEALAAAGLRE